MSLRLINSVLHDLSGTQILHTMLRYFEQDRHSPVTLMTERGQGEVVIQKVRTALTRTRRHTREAGSPIAYFGFSTEGPLRIKIDGVDHDAYAVQFHVTGLQKMKNLTLTRLKDLAL